jgi:hypothetical protein
MIAAFRRVNGLAKQTPTDIKKDAQESEAFRRRERRRQLVGIFAGVGVGLMLLGLIPGLEQSVGFFETLLWCGAIGGMLGSLASFERAGAVLTRGDNRALNLLVAFGFVAVILLLVYLLVSLLPS